MRLPLAALLVLAAVPLAAVGLTVYPCAAGSGGAFAYAAPPLLAAATVIAAIGRIRAWWRALALAAAVAAVAFGGARRNRLSGAEAVLEQAGARLVALRFCRTSACSSVPRPLRKTLPQAPPKTLTPVSIVRVCPRRTHADGSHS